MSDNVKPVKGVGFTEKERVLCIKALMTYRDLEWIKTTANSYQSPFLPPSDDEKETIHLLIDDFKGPSWDGERFNEGL